MKNFNTGNQENFSDKLIINLYLLFPVRTILRGFVTSGDAFDVTCASCEICCSWVHVQGKAYVAFIARSFSSFMACGHTNLFQMKLSSSFVCYTSLSNFVVS